jgi:hypothetical protein
MINKIAGFVLLAIVLAFNINYCFVNPPECNGGDQFACTCTPAAIRAGFCSE